MCYFSATRRVRSIYGGGVLGYWQRHPKEEIETLLSQFDDNGWLVEDPPKYYKVNCPCGSHKRTVHLTPRDPDYVKNALKWLFRQDCYREVRTA